MLPPTVTELLVPVSVIPTSVFSVPVVPVAPLIVRLPVIASVTPLVLIVRLPPREPEVLVRPSIVRLLIVVLLPNIGQVVVDVPAGITTSSPDAGTPLGLQFDAVAHAVVVPAHVFVAALAVEAPRNVTSSARIGRTSFVFMRKNGVWSFSGCAQGFRFRVFIVFQELKASLTTDEHG
jgi:hypothetical protein